VKGLIKSFFYAFSGIGRTAITQRNMKIHLCFAVLALMANTVLRLTVMEWVIILILIGLVLSFECFNTAIESLVDRFSTEEHHLSRNAKDAAAGAVLIMAIIAVIVGFIIYINAFVRLIG